MSGLPGEVRLVDHVPQSFAALVADESPRSVALSGGDLARRCYELLAVADVEWGAVDVYFGDERWVPTSDPDSNEGMARFAFVDTVEPREIHSLRHAGDTIEMAADAYDDVLRTSPPIDLVHLGLGPDGHTASLFPGTAALEVRDRFVVPNGDDLHPHPRLTFTFPAIERARLVVVTVEGDEKRDAVTRIRSGEDLPGARIRAERVIWLGDDAALRP
ncbi:MAG TPA: 6-phosphogluconolactonase [Acidimicrobiia bacterium]|nr:6-phosphogluconolactonase [Acidimicrobiia bacterium]